MTVPYSIRGDIFIRGQPRFWSDNRLVIAGPGSFDISADGKRVVGLFDEGEGKPETSLHILLNIGDELRRRGAAAGGK